MAANDLFQITKSDRINAVPVALVFEDLSGVRVEKYAGPKYTTLPLNEGVRELARMAVFVEGVPGYDSRFHRLSAVVWRKEDGTTYETPVFLHWSLFSTVSLYLQSSSGSPLVTVRFDKARFLNARRSVKVRVIGKNYLGPVQVVRVVYEDGRKSFAISDPGSYTTFPRDAEGRSRRTRYAKAALAGFPRNS